MEGREVYVDDTMEEDDVEQGENVEERRFKVGELVEFWEGASVRGNRTDSGAPAWVKVDHGEGEYGIKMVGNTRGKLRRVKWQHLFKDGSFNKLKRRESGARVRTRERLREIEVAKVQEILQDEIKSKDQELKKADQVQKATQEQAGRGLRMVEMKARQAEKYQSVLHKKQIAEMHVDLEKKRKTDLKTHDDVEREQRGKIRKLEKLIKDMQEDISETNLAKEELVKQVKRGKERLNIVRGYGDEWKAKYTEHKQKTEQTLEQKIRDLEKALQDKGTKMQELEKKCTLLGSRSLILEENLGEREKELLESVELRRQVCLIAFSLLFLSSESPLSLPPH